MNIKRELKKEINKTIALIVENYKKDIRNINIKESKLHSIHFGLGTWIRNEVLKIDSKIYALFILNNINNKDDMSSIILNKLYKYMNKIHFERIWLSDKKSER